MAAQGSNQTEIANAIGVSSATVSRWINREEIQQAIELEAKRLIDALPDAVQTTINVIKAGKDESDKLGTQGVAINSNLIEMALKEGEQLKKTVGISPSHAPSFIITNIYQDNRQQIASPIVQQLLDSHLNGLEDVIDVTPEE